MEILLEQKGEIAERPPFMHFTIVAIKALDDFANEGKKQME